MTDCHNSITTWYHTSKRLYFSSIIQDTKSKSITFVLFAWGATSLESLSGCKRLPFLRSVRWLTFSNSIASSSKSSNVSSCLFQVWHLLSVSSFFFGRREMFAFTVTNWLKLTSRIMQAIRDYVASWRGVLIIQKRIGWLVWFGIFHRKFLYSVSR